jgi:hypothetical protein
MRHESQSARRIRDQFNGYKASDIHQWFKSGLEPVSVANRGEAKFAVALACSYVYYKAFSTRFI